MVKEFAEYQKETFLSEMRVMKTISQSRSVEKKKFTAETSTEGERGKIQMEYVSRKYCCIILVRALLRKRGCPDYSAIVYTTSWKPFVCNGPKLPLTSCCGVWLALSAGATCLVHETHCGTYHRSFFKMFVYTTYFAQKFRKHYAIKVLVLWS